MALVLRINLLANLELALTYHEVTCCSARAPCQLKGAHNPGAKVPGERWGLGTRKQNPNLAKGWCKGNVLAPSLLAETQGFHMKDARISTYTHEMQLDMRGHNPRVYLQHPTREKRKYKAKTTERPTECI